MMMMVVVVVRCSYFDAQTKGSAPKLSGDISYIGTKRAYTKRITGASVQQLLS